MVRPRGRDDRPAPYPPRLVRALGGRSDLHDSRQTNRPKWGARGISVSADEGVLDTEAQNRAHEDDFGGPVDPDARMQDPDELAKALDDEDDEDDARARKDRDDNNGAPSGIRSGDEWRD